MGITPVMSHDETHYQGYSVCERRVRPAYWQNPQSTQKNHCEPLGCSEIMGKPGVILCLME